MEMNLEDQEEIAVSICDLPENVLKRIFEYIPINRINQVSQTCKLFYEILCDVRKFKKDLIITDDDEEENFETNVSKKLFNWMLKL